MTRVPGFTPKDGAGVAAVPIRRTASASCNERATLPLSPNLLEEACDAAVFLVGDPVRLTRTGLVKNAHRRHFAGRRKRITPARTSLLEP